MRLLSSFKIQKIKYSDINLFKNENESSITEVFKERSLKVQRFLFTLIAVKAEVVGKPGLEIFNERTEDLLPTTAKQPLVVEQLGKNSLMRKYSTGGTEVQAAGSPGLR